MFRTRKEIEKEHAELMQALEDFGRKVENDPEFAKDQFVKAGIIDKDGNLTEPYILTNKLGVRA